jgi:hypothetical protein
MVKRNSWVQGRQEGKRLDEDKKRDSKEKEASCQAEESAIFGW